MIALCIWLASAPQLDLQYQPITSSIRTAEAVEIADLDGDGLQDVIVASKFDGRLIWYRRTGLDAYEAARELSRDTSGVASMLVRDFDGDGDLDIVAAIAGLNTVTWYENLGGGALGPR